MDSRFTDRVAIVSGGSSGIGAAIVERLAAEGARVVVAGRNPPAAPSDTVVFERTDVSSSADVESTIDATLDRFGRLVVWSTTWASACWPRRRTCARRTGTGCSPSTSPRSSTPAARRSRPCAAAVARSSTSRRSAACWATTDGRLQRIEGGDGQLHPLARAGLRPAPYPAQSSLSRRDRRDVSGRRHPVDSRTATRRSELWDVDPVGVDPTDDAAPGPMPSPRRAGRPEQPAKRFSTGVPPPADVMTNL